MNFIELHFLCLVCLFSPEKDSFSKSIQESLTRIIYKKVDPKSEEWVPYLTAEC